MHAYIHTWFEAALATGSGCADLGGSLLFSAGLETIDDGDD